MAKELKFTRDQINKARKSRPVRVYLTEITHDCVLDGSLNELDKRIKKVITKLPIWKTFRWEDETKLKLSEVIIVTDYIGYDGGMEITIKAEKIIPEPDERVIRKLTDKAKRKVRENKKKEVQKKKELTMLKKLKEKYKDEV